MQHRNAILTLFLTALFWSLGGLLIKSIAWPPLAVAGGRAFIAAAVLALIVRPKRLSLSPLSLAAAVCYAGSTVCFVVSTKLTTAANAILLQYTSLIWVALFGAWILRERPRRSDWIVIAATIIGITLFFADKLRADGLWGIVIALVNGVFYAFLAIFLRKQKDARPVESIILGNLIGGIVCAPALVSAPALNATGWLALALLGVVQLGLPYFLYARAIQQVTALEAVLIPIIEPILNPLWVMLVIGEKPAHWAIVGGAIVICASLLRAWIAMHTSPASGGTTT